MNRLCDYNITNLSKYVLFDMFKILPLREINKLCLVHKSCLGNICNNDDFWKYYGKYIGVGDKPQNGTWKQWILLNLSRNLENIND